MKLLVLGLVLVVGLVNVSAQTERLDNRDKSFTLIKNDTLNESSIPVLKYKVIRNADKRIVTEGSVTMGKIEWTADYELTESKSTGTAASLNLSTRKIDLRPYLIKN